ncbi:C-C motif chemokine 13-like [Thunnus albacares]|uniref:C-C motif chemokine 13-like n=1 Tax=Thunnus albacares TaxID=8236 RepID=UPI001CF6063D|nr:C-C motif chemokine 13-like [Thunnus albacares]
MQTDRQSTTSRRKTPTIKMMMMKSSIILTACVVLLLSLTVEASQSSFGPDECCFKFYSKLLPKRKVMSYKYTDKMCPMEAALFTMKSGAVFCVDPSVEWVRNIIKMKDSQAAKASSSG